MRAYFWSLWTMPDTVGGIIDQFWRRLAFMAGITAVWAAAIGIYVLFALAALP